MTDDPTFEDRFTNNLPEFVNLTPVSGDPFSGVMQQDDQSEVAKPLQRLFGLNGQERYQTWPERMVRSGLTAPADALTGKLQVNDPETNMPTGEAIGRASDVAGLASGGSIGAAEKGALGSAGGRMVQPSEKAPAFYSALEHAVENTKQAKMPADQWLGTISNSKGVKPEELDWTGFKDFLTEKGKQPVTKQELQEHLNNNKVELKEVNKGHDTSKLEELQKQQQQAIRDTFTDTEGANERLDQINRELLIANNEHVNAATKYSQYQLPGGENYREKLLTLPEKETEYAKVLKQLDKKYGEDWRFGDLTNEEKELYRNFHSTHINPETYKSSHWDEPNILAHVRMNDRNIEGKKSLHLEEIQSDWHQQGREKGYKLSPEDIRDKAGIAKEDWDKMSQSQREVIQRGFPNNGVPDAPFKKSWHELALKRMIREAAEKGYDRVSWTPGEAQAARYDLSKQVNHIRYQKNSDGTYKLSAEDKSGRGHMLGENLSEQKLADSVGKEVAEKIIKDEGKKENLAPNNSPPDHWNKLSGLDLKVGGEGMKGFYDQIIPKAIEKIGKEHGVKVKTANFEYGGNGNGWQLIRFEYDGRYYIITPEGRTGAGFATRQEAQHEMKTLMQDATKQPVHYIDIPQSLKDVATQKGFPLFSSGLPFSLHPVNHDPFEEKRVNNSNHVPYGAGASNTPSGYPVNIDKRIPQYDDKLKLPNGEPADLHKYLTVHEIEEYKAMKSGVPYHKAHHDIATPMEKKAVESDGVDWKLYEHIIDGYLKKTEEEGYKNLPKQLYKKPYHSRSLIEPPPKKRKRMKSTKEMLKKNRLVEAPTSTIIEKKALEFAAIWYDAARSSGLKSTKTQKQWARDNFTRFIPHATKILMSMLGRSDIADIQKQEIHQALLERINDPEMVMLDELSEAHLSQYKFNPTEH